MFVSGYLMLTYPALLDLATRTTYPLGVSKSFLVGRNETADLCVFDPMCSRHHFRIVGREGHFYVEPLNAQNPTYCNGQPIRQAQLLEHGSLIQAGQTQFQFLLRPQTKGDAPKSKSIEPEPLLTIKASAVPGRESVLDADPIAVSGDMVIGREQGRVQVYLPHPQVSRRHARLSLRGTTATLTDLKSANGTFVNGVRVKPAIMIRPGDQLDIGPYALQFTGTSLIPRSRTDNIELIARNVKRIVRNRETGKRMALLDDVTLVIRPREFVCLLGPSGSGKSTLLSALSGRAPADEGAVLLNGKDLYANFEALKQDIAVVPQKDVLHDSLAVGQALWYTAKLRLPPDTTRAEIQATLREMLDTVGLTTRQATVIRHLSGGQVKRASLANEIVCKPSLLFLDEVTSGLDEQTDREVMNLFRSLADAGKTVVCITHSLANVERTCHLVVILTPGGKVAFIGKPSEALEYFGIERLGDVYDKLVQQPADHWQQLYLKSPLWQRYVGDRLPAGPGAERAVDVPVVRAGGRIRLFVRQTLLLTRRYAAIWRGDYPSMLAMAGQAVVVAVLLGLLFGDLSKLSQDLPDKMFDYANRSVNLMFLMAVSSFWFGCNNAAKEIVKERTIYTRERDFNLLVGSYYTSKLFLLTIFSCLQAALMFVIVRFWCNPPGSAVEELLVLLTLSLAGVTLGLAISAIAASEEMAITLIPMVVIPQIILSGVIAPLEGVSKVLALSFVSTYWGKRALDACMPEKVANTVHVDQHSLVVALLVLLGHALFCLISALVVLHWQNRRRRFAAFLMRAKR